MSELLIGSGSSRDKRIHVNSKREWSDLTTLDYEPRHNPDVVHDLHDLPLPFADNTFSEIHAYEVLEHIHTQGDYVGFFALFSELWRILKPEGCICFTVPHWQSVWAWGDPSHTRVITFEQMTFLSQKEYEKQVGKTPMSDFRSIYKADLEVVWHDTSDGIFKCVLQAVK